MFTVKEGSCPLAQAVSSQHSSSSHKESSAQMRDSLATLTMWLRRRSLDKSHFEDRGVIPFINLHSLVSNMTACCKAPQCGTSAKLRRILRSAPVSWKQTVPPYPTIASRGGTAYSTSTSLKPSCADCLAAGMAVDAARLRAGTTAWDRDLEMELMVGC